MGKNVTMFARGISAVAMGFWTLLCAALGVYGALLGDNATTSAAPSAFWQGVAVFLTVVTVLAWVSTAMMRRTREAALLALFCCSISAIITFYLFVEREHSTVPTMNGAIVMAVVLFLTMVGLLGWQAYGRHDDKRDAAK